MVIRRDVKEFFADDPGRKFLAWLAFALAMVAMGVLAVLDGTTPR